MADLRRCSLTRLRTSQTRLHRMIRVSESRLPISDIRALLCRPLARAILETGAAQLWGT